jgi:AcrR family transcriptional regulator
MTTESRPHSPAKRVDAERNREKILAAGRAAFADPDADASMAEIARRAGIGSATLYRNFANRRALLEALYTSEVDALCDAAATIEGDTPGAVFTAWVRRFYTYFTSKRHVAAELLEHTDSSDPIFGAGLPRVLAAGQPLLEAARDAGAIRSDLTLDQILALIVSVAKIQGSAEYVEPILQAALDALGPARRN